MNLHPQLFEELKVGIMRICLALFFILLSLVFLDKSYECVKVCSFEAKEEFSCRLASTPCLSALQVNEQCEKQRWTGIKHSAGQW